MTDKTEAFFNELMEMAKQAYTLQGHTEVQGIPVSVENRKGSVRKGTDKDGNEWRTKMKFPYGYIPRTRGADGEPVDCYVGPDKEAPTAYVVHQHKEDGTGYNEDKIMLAFQNKKQAREAFLEHYDSSKFLGPISEVPIDRLKELISSKRRLVKISHVDMEKEAVGPLTVAAIGGLSHLGANIGLKAAHNTRLLKKIRANRLAEGLRSGIEGTPQKIKSRLLESWVAPEPFVGEHVGRHIGGLLRNKSQGQQVRALKKLRKSVAMSPELHHTPLFEDIVPGVNKALEKRLPKVAPVQQAGLSSKMAPLAMAPIVAAVEPAGLVHGAINRTRMAVAKSDAGKRFMARGGRKGYVEGLMNKPSKTFQERLVDTIVSPAALNTERIGRALGDLTPNDPFKAKRLAGAAHTIIGNKKAGQLSSKAVDQLERIMSGKSEKSSVTHLPPSFSIPEGPRGVRF